MRQRPSADEAKRVAAIAAGLGLERPVVTELPGGIVNRTLRLQDARHDYVLRLAGATGTGLGASHASEFAMLSRAAAAGLAPGIVRSEPAQGYVVMQHVAGRTPDASAVREAAFLRRLGHWIARLHALAPPPGLPSIDFGARAAAYLEELRARRSDPQDVRLLSALTARRAALPAPARICSCHHDLHRRNLVDTGKALFVLDWEYAGPGDPSADLAACAGYHFLGPSGIDALLAGYGQDSQALRARLAMLGWIFDCLWYGWNGVAALAGHHIDADLQRRLGARLLD